MSASATTWQRARACSSDGCMEIGWTKAKACNLNGNSVEVGEPTAGSCGFIHVRDSNDPERVVNVPAADFGLFLQGVKNGEFDHLITT